MSRFIPGLELNKGFYFDVVEPLMEEHFPDLIYSAGLVGHGSDVLGFDSPTSMDHDWGPRLHLFFSDVDFISAREQVDAMLRAHLPPEYKGFPTNFVEGDYYLKHTPKLKRRGPINHLFSFWTPRSFFQHYLGFDIDRRPSMRDWLLFPQQALIEVTAGVLYHDGLRVQRLRDQFRWYPEDIWKYLMRTQWGKISDELQSPARSAEEGDEVGSMVITGRNVHKIMLMCFLMERTYAPYPKWFGTAFERWLRSSKDMYPLLLAVFREKNGMKRQKLLTDAYVQLGKMHEKLHLTRPVKPQIGDFHGRGYSALKVEDYIAVLEESIRTPKLKDMKYPLGAIDQFIDHARINQVNYVYTELGNIID